MQLTVNGVKREVSVSPDTPLLWVLRDLLGLTGTKYSCGMAQCGACTVHVGGQPLRSCVMPLSAVAGKAITTIETKTAELRSRLATLPGVGPGAEGQAAHLLCARTGFDQKRTPDYRAIRSNELPINV